MFALIRFQCSVLKEIDRSLILFGYENCYTSFVNFGCWFQCHFIVEFLEVIVMNFVLFCLCLFQRKTKEIFF